MCSYSEDEVDYDDPRFLLPEGVGDDTEQVEWYKPGGFHPVHLGDTFDEGRYKVVNKLGAGGFSTVWLARDVKEQNWVALKITDADHADFDPGAASHYYATPSVAGSEHVVPNCRRFTFDGPNGHHLCFVLPVLGPSLSSLSNNFEARLTPSFARRAAYEATQALAELHAQGICHGDLTIGNLLLGVANLDGCSEEDIYELFGPPATGALETVSEEITGPEAPRYIVGDMNFLAAPASVVKPGIQLLDFDQSFPTSSPPKQVLGTPRDYLAPEVAAGLPASTASDVWALGCCIFRLRSGEGPFSNPYMINCPADIFSFVIYTLKGEVPAQWRTVLFTEDGMPTDDPSKGRHPGPWRAEEKEERSLRDLVHNIWDEPEVRVVHTEFHRKETIPPLPEEKMPFSESWGSIVWNPRAVRVDDAYLTGFDDTWPALRESLPKIPEQEAALLYDLLSTIFVYDPAKRPSAEQLLEHPYFHL